MSELLMFVAGWWLVGIASFLLWSSKYEDITLQYFCLGCFVAFAGPIAFLMGWIIFGEKVESKPIIIMRKRGSK